MWKFKPFAQKQSTSLEGRSIDVGNVKVHVRNSIAEGGFSCVYLARDAIHPTRQYALKHIICNDGESLENVMKEISVMKLLMGHPNITKLFSYAILDMGRTKEALLLMEFCEMSLITFLENRVEFFEEKHILLLFRDVCNAVFAMHCLKPPIAHRDLKAENVLLGADGAWKLCDFGSTSTNHKCFTKPEEMGIEEDNIRRHTTPAYRAPEMWDLYRRDVISEKVDIWALGCLLYRICFLKSAFDGESKLQITNVHYHIPETSRYSQTMIGLVKDMIQGSPDARPDITQVWFRVNELLPMELQKHLPNSCPATNDGFHFAKLHQQRVPKGDNMTYSPQPASKEHGQRISATSNKERQQPETSQRAGKASDNGIQIGSFWSTKHAQNSHVINDKAPTNHEIRASPMETKHISQKPKSTHMESNSTSLNNSSNIPFPTHTDQPTAGNTSVSFKNSKNATEEQTEVKNLRDQLKQANLEKAEIASKYEKLSAICQSQRQEIDKLKCALVAATTTTSSKNNSKNHTSSASVQSTNLQKEKLDPNILELEQAMAANSLVQATATETSVLSIEPQPWQTFDEDPKAMSLPNNVARSCILDTAGRTQ